MTRPRLFSLLLMLTLGLTGGHAQHPPASTSAITPGSAASAGAIKAAMLLKLPRFVYYPAADSGQPLQLCLLGRRPLDGALGRLLQQTQHIVDGRPVQLHRLETLEALETLGKAPSNQACDFVFVSQTLAAQRQAVLLALAALPAVSVSDISGFAQAGGMVELAPNPQDPQRLAIFLNPQAAQAHGIKFNAQLLRLATLIQP